MGETRDVTRVPFSYTFNISSRPCCGRLYLRRPDSAAIFSSSPNTLNGALNQMLFQTDAIRDMCEALFYLKQTQYTKRPISVAYRVSFCFCFALTLPTSMTVGNLYTTYYKMWNLPECPVFGGSRSRERSDLGFVFVRFKFPELLEQ
jgi:hypothetical protein